MSAGFEAAVYDYTTLATHGDIRMRSCFAVPAADFDNVFFGYPPPPALPLPDAPPTRVLTPRPDLS